MSRTRLFLSDFIAVRGASRETEGSARRGERRLGAGLVRVGRVCLCAIAVVDKRLPDSLAAQLGDGVEGRPLLVALHDAHLSKHARTRPGRM
jgi:hypothetical protein